MSFTPRYRPHVTTASGTDVNGSLPDEPSKNEHGGEKKSGTKLDLVKQSGK